MMNSQRVSFNTRDLVFCALMSVIIAVCSWISIPIGTIPFTLQTMGIMLALGILGGERGTVSIIVYIMLGAIGAPVFAGFKSGAGVLFGVTGGYILGFLVMGIIYIIITHFFGAKQPVKFIASIMGLIACYVFGTAWFFILYNHSVGPTNLQAVLEKCVTPFLIPEIGKIILANIIIDKLPSYIKKG